MDCVQGRRGGAAFVVSVVLFEVLGAGRVGRGGMSERCCGRPGWSELSGVIGLISVVRSMVVP